MASIRKEIVVDVDPKRVWDAVRDVGAPHTRLAPGFLVDTRMEEGARIVTFANGLVARELIVWAVVGGRLTNHNASMQEFDEDGRSRVVWIADLLPNELAPTIAGLIEQGLATMKKTLEKG